MGLSCALLKTFREIFQEPLAVYDCHDKDSRRLNSIYQTIAINEPLSYVLVSDLRNNATDRRKFS